MQRTFLSKQMLQPSLLQPPRRHRTDDESPERWADGRWSARTPDRPV